MPFNSKDGPEAIERLKYLKRTNKEFQIAAKKLA